MSQPHSMLGTSQPHVALAVTGVATGASAVSWATDHAVWFTIAAGTAAVLSGIAAFVFYMVSTYYKIKKGGE